MGLDRYSRIRGDEELARRAGLALSLAQAGFADQVALGHDGSPYMRLGSAPPPGTDVTACWLPVPELEIPWLREHGATEDQIDGMCRRSVQSTFEAAAGMAG